LRHDVAKLAAFRGRGARTTQEPMRGAPDKIISHWRRKAGSVYNFYAFEVKEQIDVSGLTKFNGEVFLRPET
jgi:hypothetical protein